MIAMELPAPDRMMRAFLERDASFEGVFWVGVTTTGIYCRPTCPARKPKADNVRFFADPDQAELEGFRPCLRCRPRTLAGSAPDWLQPLLKAVEGRLDERWGDRRLRAMGLHPVRVRRWFQSHLGLSFHQWLRARRLGGALQDLHDGEDLLHSGLDAGFESASGFRDAFTHLFGEPPGRARERIPLYWQRILTPLGPMVALVSEDGLALLEFVDRKRIARQICTVASRLGGHPAPGKHPLLDCVAAQIEEYFAGQRRKFDLPLVMAGTPFQQQVWQELCRIPFGETRSYGQLAARLDRPGGQRAVGAANGRNLIAIVVPCHRVVRSDGALGGYGGGLWRKKALLAVERRAEQPC